MTKRTNIVCDVGRSICAWCGRITAIGDISLPETHGICASCAVQNGFMEVYSLPDADHTQLDALPFGIIRLGYDNKIVAYNEWESAFARRSPESVIGKCFFTEVAPCTNVQSFHGVVRQLQEAGVSGACEFDFVFEFAHGYTMVFIQAIYNPVNRTTLLMVQQKK